MMNYYAREYLRLYRDFRLFSYNNYSLVSVSKNIGIILGSLRYDDSLDYNVNKRIFYKFYHLYDLVAEQVFYNTVHNN